MNEQRSLDLELELDLLDELSPPCMGELDIFEPETWPDRPSTTY